MPTKPPSFRPTGHVQATQATERQRQRVKSYRYGADWQRIRNAKLQRNPLCAHCEADGLVVAASVVHHIIDVSDDPSRRLDMTNLESLCAMHHNAITATRQHNRK